MNGRPRTAEEALAAVRALLDPVPRPRYDDDGCFLGHETGNPDAHRTVGRHRAWSGTGEWCYPETPCESCLPRIDQGDVREALGDWAQNPQPAGHGTDTSSAQDSS